MSYLTENTLAAVAIIISTALSYCLSFLPCFFGNIQNNLTTLGGPFTSWMNTIANSTYSIDGIDIVAALGVSLQLQTEFIWPRAIIGLLNMGFVLSGILDQTLGTIILNLVLIFCACAFWLLVSIVTTALNLINVSWLPSHVNYWVSVAIVLIVTAFGSVPLWIENPYYNKWQVANLIQVVLPTTSQTSSATSGSGSSSGSSSGTSAKSGSTATSSASSTSSAKK